MVVFVSYYRAVPSSPIDRPHPGFLQAERVRWLEVHGFTLEEAQAWDRRGFSPERAAPWHRAGFRNPVDALTWGDDAGFQPEEAWAFSEKGYSPARAMAARRRRLTGTTAPDRRA